MVNFLTDAMRDDGWRTFGAYTETGDDEWIVWMHEPTRQVLTIDPGPRSSWVGPTWGPEPKSPDVKGYTITLRVHDEEGFPFRGDGFWVELPFMALRLARRIRADVLSGVAKGVLAS